MSDQIVSQVPSAPPAADNDAAPQPSFSLPLQRRLRLWPGVAIIALMWIATKLVNWYAPATMTQFMVLFWAPLASTALLTIWWLFFSRLRWLDRLLGLVAFAGIGTAEYFLAAGADNMARFMFLIMLALPAALTAWVVWPLVTPSLSWPWRRAGLLVLFVLVWGYFTLIRVDGITGSMAVQTSWRWSRTAEQKFLDDREKRQQELKDQTVLAPAPAELLTGDWPGFRGEKRDGKLSGVRLVADWTKYPPKQLWRQRVGPGWSSFAVIGQRLYTQEQRGPDEAVVCYNTNNGAEVWAHVNAARFTEVVAGPGPRATPTYHDGKIYALGATGLLDCLDAETGKVAWSRDIMADSKAKLPIWGFASSPLVAQGVVTVFAGGPDGKSVLGYSPATGELLWSGGDGQLSYCSTQLAKLGGVEQLLITTDTGLTALEPKKGSVLWEHKWPTEATLARIVQPAVLDGDDVLIGTGMSFGTRRLHVSHEGKEWQEKAVWTTRALKPYYNDFVVHKGHIYGFDGIFFTCVNLDDGKMKWRERGYGNGQVLLLVDQGMLLILSETGEVALVEAIPEEHKERARFQALEGKTWNHPVIAHGKLFVRNGEEMACYELTEEPGKQTALFKGR